MNKLGDLEQTTQDAVKHPLIKPNCITSKKQKKLPPKN